MNEFLASATMLSIPIAYAAIGGVLCERSGVYNIGLEGALMMGAFGAATGGYFLGSPYLGVLTGLLAGLAFGVLLGFLTVRFGMDQFVAGIAANLFALGLTTYAARIIFKGEANTTVVNGLTPLWPDCPVPILGPILLSNDILAFLLIALVIALSWTMNRTRWGLAIRAAGNDPRAADNAGLNVGRIRFLCVVLGTGVAAIGGCHLVLRQVSVLTENISNGIGYIALAAIILGRWNSYAAALACFLFGVCQRWQLELQYHSDLPYQLFSMIPYLASILALVIFANSSRMPRAAGKHYERNAG